MRQISFKLDAFEGPLDLLLHLISKHKLNIYDIEISVLLEQYMEYMNRLEAEDFESAADFLEMAARLIYIKTCSLLPQPEEAQELKKELEGRIIEYSLCKQAAEALRKVYAGGQIFVRAPQKLPVNKAYTRTHDVSVLYDAYMGISSKVKTYKPLRANVFSPIVSHRIVSVTSKIIFVLKKLYKTGSCQMERLYDGITDKSEKVATFLAVLELTKSGRIYINEDNTEIKFLRREKNKRDNDNEQEVDVTFGNDEDVSQYDEPLPNDQTAEAVTESFVEEESETAKDEDSISDNDIEEELSDDKKTEIKSAVRFSSERLVSSHTVSMKIEPEKPQAVAAFAPMAVAEEAAEEHEAETENSAEEISEEISTLTEPPVTVFKPNYWSSRSYYWGNVSVGDDAQGNYWRFGGK